MFIDLTLDEDVAQAVSSRSSLTEVDDAVLAIELLELEDSEDDQIDLDYHRSHSIKQRNPPISLPYCTLDVYKNNTFKIHSNEIVELHDGSFLLVNAIVENATTGEVTVRGNQIVRAKQLEGLLERKLNECALILDIDLDDPRAPKEQSIVEIELANIKCTRPSRFTNRKFPGWRMIPNTFAEHEVSELFSYGGLTIRWVFVTYYDCAAQRIKGTHFRERMVRRITVDECSAGFAVDEAIAQSRWRGQNKVVGAAPVSGKYTFLDAFSGVGGAARGAKAAGAEILFGFDFDARAAQAWSDNFPEATGCNLSADEFITLWKALPNEILIDILHISPPCQVFSPVHTREGQHDEMNSASLFAIIELISLCKPRIVTLEQTFGLLTTRKFRGYFNSMVHMFTALNFSVRWAVIPLVELGLPQTRKRLIVIASCPGQELPTFPARTHSASGGEGLEKFVTVNQALRNVRVNSRDDPDLKLFPPEQSRSPYNGNEPLNRTITTQGADKKAAPCGERSFTVRELAALQGFPPLHIFRGPTTSKIKQIGNAFPPVVTKALFSHIIEHLKATDNVRDQQPIVID